MRFVILFLLAVSIAGAVASDHVAKMIACEEAEEALVSDAYTAFLTLVETRQLPKEHLKFPFRLVVKHEGGFIISRAYYISPNMLRGFEIFVPSDCVVVKNGIMTSSTELEIVGEDSKQGITLLELRRKPNKTPDRTAPSVTAPAAQEPRH